MIGCDIRNMDADTKEILLNKEVLKINQDPKGCQPFFANNYVMKPNEMRKSEDPYFLNYPLEVPVIAKYLDNGDIALGIFNFMDKPANRWFMTLTCDHLGLPRNCGKTFECVDVWSGEVVKAFNDTLSLDEIAPHACRLFRVKIVDK